MLTGLLIALLAVVGAAAVVGGGLVVLGRRGERALESGDRPLLGEPGAGALLERPIKDIRVGDVIQHEGRDYLVEGVVEYDEDGHRWRAARIVDGATERWLIIGLERGGAVSLRLVEVDAGIHVSGYPPDKLVTEQASYTQESRGTATARVVGDAGKLPGTDGAGPDSVLRCRFWRYETPGKQCLVVEQWGGLYRVLRGEVLDNRDIEMIPGS